MTNKHDENEYAETMENNIFDLLKLMLNNEYAINNNKNKLNKDDLLDRNDVRDFTYIYDLTAYKVSKITGIPTSTLSRLKSGKINVDNLTLKNVKKLSSLYQNVLFDDLLSHIVRDLSNKKEGYRVYGYNNLRTLINSDEKIKHIFENSEYKGSVYQSDVLDYVPFILLINEIEGREIFKIAPYNNYSSLSFSYNHIINKLFKDVDFSLLPKNYLENSNYFIEEMGLY